MPASAPAASSADLQRFEEVYSLHPGQVAKFIPRPFIPERTKYLTSLRMPLIDQELLTFRRDGKLHWTSASLGDETAEVPVEFCAGLDWYHLDDPRHLLRTKMPGDWVIRDGAPRERILLGIAELLSAKLGRDVHFMRHTEARDLIIVTGRFERDKKLPELSLVVGTAPPPGAQKFGPSHSRLRNVLNQFGQEVHTQVIDQAAGVDKTITWWDFDVKPANIERDMASLAAQTGLTFKRESRNMEIWTILSGPPAGS